MLSIDFSLLAYGSILNLTRHVFVIAKIVSKSES
ncbi:uncharacterized protein METZ01_LOCUS228890 [marine metagenome]|uniref:Uncharacterized protein n=1 Tax=marine metagenome TaxID=408172 RepID=A0A382GLK5_9ZZZZ